MTSDADGTARFSLRPVEDEPARPPRYTVTITGSALYDGYLCLQYAVSPTPPPLIGDRSLHEGGDVGLAVDRHRHVYHGGHTGYRTSRSGSRVVGALKIGPATWTGLGPVRVLFPPFAHTPGLDRILCEVQVIIDAGRVRSASVRRC
jgi:hypothetical protein